MLPTAHILYGRLESELSEALQTFPSAERAHAALVARSVNALVTEFAAENQLLLEDFRRGSMTAAVINHPDSLHFATFFNASTEILGSIAEAVRDPDVRKCWPLPGIWSQYADAALFSLGLGPRISINLKPRGSEKRYVPLIQLMNASSVEEKEKFEQEAATLFAAANADKRIVDWIGLDGDGNKPVKWNFRLHAIKCGP